jgi:structural maintenance of chromosome 1
MSYYLMERADFQTPELLAVQTKIAHSEKLAKNASGNAARVERDEQRQADTLADLESGAKDIERAMKDAAEKQKKKAATSGKALSQADLDEYRKL